jgi:hypothetical protein
VAGKLRLEARLQKLEARARFWGLTHNRGPGGVRGALETQALLSRMSDEDLAALHAFMELLEDIEPALAEPLAEPEAQPAGSLEDTLRLLRGAAEELGGEVGERGRLALDAALAILADLRRQWANEEGS